jgi:hypothetical protein
LRQPCLTNELGSLGERQPPKCGAVTALLAGRSNRSKPDARKHVLRRHDVGRLGHWNTSPRRSSAGRRGSREIPSIEVTRLAVAWGGGWPSHAIDSATLHNATVTTALLARPVDWHTMTAMRRLRLLGGLLGCLAVLAASLPAVALGLAPSLSSALTQTTASEPCDHCPDCQGGPCQPAMTGCMQICTAPAPALGVASFSLQAFSTTETIGLRSPPVLHGRSPPPDPFPPRI